MRESMAVARVKLRARASSSHPAIPLRERERFGPFYLHEQLGEGGMAQVHRASRIDGTGGPIALKRLWPHLGDDRDFVESFVQEARLTRLLRHANIAQTYELGKANGQYYIAMELVTGPTLDSVMRQARTAAGAIPLPIIVEILIQLCDALDHAHNLCDELGRPLRLIHRDVSPANIILAKNGRIKLIDFGIAKAARSRVRTEAGTIKGKLAYVAPEYTYGRLDARADLFAVGAVAHEMLTGHRLFAAATEIATIQNVRELAISPPSRHDRKVSRDLDDIVLTALSRDPDQRWQSAAAMGRALRGVAEEIGRVDGQEILRWVQWAFTREPWSESGIGRILDTLEVSRATVAPTREREAPATVPIIPALVRKPKLLVEPLVEDEDAPTYEDVPPTVAFAKPEHTQLTRGFGGTKLLAALITLFVVAAVVAIVAL